MIGTVDLTGNASNDKLCMEERLFRDKTNMTNNHRSSISMLKSKNSRVTELQNALEDKNREISRLRMQFDDMCKRI